MASMFTLIDIHNEDPNVKWIIGNDIIISNVLDLKDKHNLMKKPIEKISSFASILIFVT